MEDVRLNSIEEAVEDFKEGKFVIVVDDEDRENEGDLIIAAEKIDADKVNFMLKHARGVLCAPITISRCDEPFTFEWTCVSLGPTRFQRTHPCLELHSPSPSTNSKDAAQAYRHTTELRPSKPWPTPTPHPRPLDVQDISTPYMHKTTECFAEADIPKPPSTFARWRDSTLPAH